MVDLTWFGIFVRPSSVYRYIKLSSRPCRLFMPTSVFALFGLYWDGLGISNSSDRATSKFLVICLDGTTDWEKSNFDLTVRAGVTSKS